jgi:hypothetical protein
MLHLRLRAASLFPILWRLAESRREAARWSCFFRFGAGGVRGRALLLCLGTRAMSATAQRRALRRMGDNDAWQAAIAERLGSRSEFIQS